jgi:Type IV secretion-system coupling protein DNA-binding domain
MASQWGRKETVIWPPQVPIYTYGVLLLAIPIMLTLLFGLYMTKPFLARNYTGAFIKSAAGSQFHRHDSYRLIYLGGGKRAPRVAQPTDFASGTTDLPGGKKIGIALSPAATAQGFTTIFRGPERKFADQSIHAWLQADIFGGDDLMNSYGAALVEAGIAVIFMLGFAVPWDFKRGKMLKYGRLLRGPEMHTPQAFNRILKGDGMGIRTNEKGTIVRLPSRSEPKHIQVMGDTGVGKTTLLIQMLSQIEDRGDSAIIYDPAGEFIQRFYREGRGRCGPQSARRALPLLDAFE